MALTLNQIYHLSLNPQFRQRVEIAVVAQAARELRTDPTTLPSYSDPDSATKFYHVAEANSRRALARQVTSNPATLREKVQLAGRLLVYKADETATEAGSELSFPPVEQEAGYNDPETPVEDKQAIEAAYLLGMISRPTLEALIAERWPQMAGFDLAYEKERVAQAAAGV